MVVLCCVCRVTRAYVCVRACVQPEKQSSRKEKPHYCVCCVYTCTGRRLDAPHTQVRSSKRRASFMVWPRYHLTRSRHCRLNCAQLLYVPSIVPLCRLDDKMTTEWHRSGAAHARARSHTLLSPLTTSLKQHSRATTAMRSHTPVNLCSTTTTTGAFYVSPTPCDPCHHVHSLRTVLLFLRIVRL